MAASTACAPRSGGTEGKVSHVQYRERRIWELCCLVAELKEVSFKEDSSGAEKEKTQGSREVIKNKRE